MTEYTATVLDGSGQNTHSEVVTAPTEEEARTALSNRGMTVLEIKAPGKGMQRELSFGKKRVKITDLAVFARIFATMTASGMNLLRTLQILTDQTENPTLKAVLGDVTTDVESGLSLSAAMDKHSEIFPPLMSSMIKAGEAGGFLDTALVNVAESLESDVKIRGDIKSAAAYPLVVLAFGVLAFIGILLFIIPIFVDMFASLGGQLPLPTRIAVGMSEIMKWLAPVLAVAAVVFSFWWRAHKNDRRTREVLDPIKLKLPVFGTIISKIAIARLTRNLSVMLTSGVPILESLQIAAPTANNTVIEGAVANAAVYVRNGQSLGSHLGDDGIVPRMVVEMVIAGEETGELDTMLSKSAEFFEQQVAAATKALSSTLEPLLIATVGVLIGGLVIAMYMPIFEVFNLIG